MNPPTSADTEKIHAQYKALTGLDVPYTMQTHFMWESWLASGFTEPDLACVIRYLKSKIKDGKRPKESLLPRNLIQRTDFFGEDLAIARAEARNTHTPTPRERILAQSGRSSDEPKDAAQRVRSILERTKLAEMLKQWKAENL